MRNRTSGVAWSEDPLGDPFGDVPLRAFGWAPAVGVMHGTQQVRVEVVERDDAYTVHAELPGVTKESIRVTVDGRQVLIEASRGKPSEADIDRRVVRTERSAAPLSRSFTLGRAIDEDRAQAKFESGILTLTLPKKGGDAVRRLTIT